MPTYVLGSDGVSVFQILVNQADGNSIEVLPAPGASPTNNVVSNAISNRALDVIKSALRLIGVQASGESLDIATANDGLSVLNQMIDAWNASRLSIFTTDTQDFALVAGQQEYTLGAGGNWVMNRPAKIDSVSVILRSNPANPIEIPISMYSVQDWQTKVPVKSVSGAFPTICFDDGGFPSRTMSLWPIPTDATNKVRVYAWAPLGGAATLQTALSFPFGYAEAFRYNLAVRLAAEFGAQLPPIVLQLAMDAMAVIRRMNAPDLSLSSDLSSSSTGYNYRAEMFGLPY